MPKTKQEKRHEVLIRRIGDRTYWRREQLDNEVGSPYHELAINKEAIAEQDIANLMKKLHLKEEPK